MAGRRTRHWVFLGPTPLVARFRFREDPHAKQFLPGSSLLWHSVLPETRGTRGEDSYAPVEGYLRCPRCGHIHPYAGLVYEGDRSHPWAQARHWPDVRLLGLLCEAAEKAPCVAQNETLSGEIPAALEARVEDLCDAWRRCRARGGEVVLFAGAGVSSASGVPTARDLRRQLGVAPASPAGLRSGLENPDRVFGILADLVRAVDGVRAAPGPSHRLVRRLKETGVCDWVLTTNGDGLLEAAGVEAIRVFDREETDGWAAALETGVSHNPVYARFLRHVRAGKIGLFISVGASRLVGRELGAEFEGMLTGGDTDLFLISPERPRHAPGSRWLALTGESALDNLLKALRPEDTEGEAA